MSIENPDDGRNALCGGLTNDVAGGPCDDCWGEANVDGDEP